MKPSIIPSSLQGKELYDFVVKNEELIIHAKKSEVKKADGVRSESFFINEGGSLVVKSAAERPSIPETATKLQLDVIINTTNYYDSHMDVHIPGLWNKSLSDNKSGFYLLDTHGRHFKDVIGEGMKGAVKTLPWSNLGFKFAGVTEALLFSGPIEQVRNPEMFKQYAKGYVKQHSVGMRYVRLLTCINDDDYPVQKENWDKYFPMIVNSKDAEADGIFWAILEAQVIEGSAVLFGSNDATPTQSVEDISTKNEPPVGTQEEPHEKQADDFFKQLSNSLKA